MKNAFVLISSFFITAVIIAASRYCSNIEGFRFVYFIVNKRGPFQFITLLCAVYSCLYVLVCLGRETKPSIRHIILILTPLISGICAYTNGFIVLYLSLQKIASSETYIPDLEQRIMASKIKMMETIIFSFILELIVIAVFLLKYTKRKRKHA